MYSWDYVLIILQVTLSFVASQQDLTYQLKIIFTDQPKYIVRGSEVHLTCVLTGGNQPHLTWISPLRTLPEKCRTENGGSTLIIPNYEESDNGQYICVASDGQRFANHVFTLNMNDHRTSTSTELTTMTTTTSTTMKTTIPTTATRKSLEYLELMLIFLIIGYYCIY
ncbi:MAM domain-containing glycosylphosphatidylinositol anchor protein 2-like [Saccostrea cucullata]|uniref:MAM domain-containing glycosylphosphatidylinositol anchor protein 2-like n=1 Tax=Saccostrea cuccullata TaxID=36930 RepID=UPI002ED5119D